MNSIRTFFVGIFLLALPAFADDASKHAKIEEMMQITHADRMMTQMLDQMNTMLTNQFGKMDVSAKDRQAMDEMQQKLIKMVADRMSWAKTKPAFAKIYAETFTEADIDGILMFYKTPAGQAMLDKMPLLIQKSVAVGQELMGDMMPDIQRMVEESKQKYNPR